MKVDIIACTEHPMEVVSEAAATCYGKSGYSERRVKTCYDSGHMSVFEHASVTFRVEGISRACSHQLVRHRVASYSQLSQRYTKVDTESGDWYVMPKWFEDTFSDDGIFWKQAFEEAMENCAVDYQEALERGCRPEDARYLLPEAVKTTVTVTMNLRELYHFLDLRQVNAAQWEIRELADKVEAAVRDANAEWSALMDLRGMGQCGKAR